MTNSQEIHKQVKVTKGRYKNLLGYIGNNGEADLFQGNRKILTTLKADEYKVISKGGKNG